MRTAESSGETRTGGAALTLLHPFTLLLLLKIIRDVSEVLLPHQKTLSVSHVLWLVSNAGLVYFTSCDCALLSAGNSRRPAWRRISCFLPAAVCQPGFPSEACRSRYSRPPTTADRQAACTTALLSLQGLLSSLLQDAHEQGINAASFSCEELLATGGSDRVVKLWDVSSGVSSHVSSSRVRAP